MNASDRLIVVLGPTASGKSALAIALAKSLGGEILVCDSAQVYRRYDVGTAKMPAAEQHGIPHHLVDVVEWNETFTAGDYRRQALALLEDLRRRGKVPIVVAGTGLYLRALLEGLADAPKRSDELRERLKRQAARRKPGYLHRVLRKLDPEAAGRIAAQDTQKLVRAIEICLLSGKTVTSIQRQLRPRLEGFHIVKLGLLPARPDLYARIEQRVLAMLEHGWVEEIRALLASGVPPSAKPFGFIGYKQLREYAEGRTSREKATLDIQQATRRYAKRQLTWFHREPCVHWLEGFGDDPRIQQAALAHLAVAAGA
jgi:tRNA dimethylallyltransferase